MQAKLLHDILDFQYCIDGFDSLSQDEQYSIIRGYILDCIDNCIDTLNEVHISKEDETTWYEYLYRYQATFISLQDEETRESFLNEYHPKEQPHTSKENKTMEQYITFWQDPNARRYERLVRENVVHVGKVNGFKAIDDFFFTYTAGYTTLSHDNIDVLFSVQDDKLVIIEWAKHANNDGTVNNEIKQVYTLSDYPLVQDLAVYLENKHK